MENQDPFLVLEQQLGLQKFERGYFEGTGGGKMTFKVVGPRV